MHGAYLTMLAATAVALVWLPSTITINDEFFYAGQAAVLGQGRLLPQVGDALALPGRSAAELVRYPVAWPLLLAPARLLSFQAMHLVTLLLHLIGAAAFARMLVRRNVPSVAVALYLFHPALWTYSRTLMSDVPATAALLLAMDAWENRSRWSLLLALAFVAAARLPGLVVVVGFVAATAMPGQRREVALGLLGIPIALAAQLAVNVQVHGVPWLSPYAKDSLAFLSFGAVPSNLGLYAAGLLLLPPFSLAAAAAAGSPPATDRWALIAAVVVLAYLPVAYHDRSVRLVETLVGGQRYALPAHAALMVATASLWGRWKHFRRTAWVVLVGACCGAVGAMLTGRIEDRHGRAVHWVRQCEPRVLAFNQRDER